MKKILIWIVGFVVLTAIVLTHQTPVGAQSDTTPPIIIDVTLDPAFVDTAASAQTITVTAHISDDLSGLYFSDMRFRPEIGTTQFVDVRFQADNLISGTTVDGLYQATMTLPRYAAWGRWRTDFTSTTDQVGNGVYLSRCCDAPMPWYFVNQRDSSQHALYMPSVHSH